MPIYIQRFFIQVIPYVACSTIAALIIWGEDIRSIRRLLIWFIVLSSAAQTATYLTHIELIRFPLEIISGFIIAFLVFKKPILWVVKIYITSYVLGTVTVVTILNIILALGIMPSLDLYENVRLWLYAGLPSNFAMLLIAFLVHIGKLPFKTFYYPMRRIIPRVLPVLLAAFIQMIILVSFNADFYLQGLNTGFRTLILFFLYGISIYIFIRFVRLSVQEAESSVQDGLAENIRDMVNSIKGQRHDFNNHLHVINTLFQHNNYAALKEYLHDLLKETSQYNELLKIDNPVLSALINAKIARANDRGITVDFDIQTGLSEASHASLELSRIIGNLMDNAIDELEASSEDKAISLSIVDKGPLLVISVGNPWKGDPHIVEKALKSGFSTKGETGHQGLGLQICKQLAKKIHAGFDYCYEPEGILRFNLMVPKK